MAENKMVETDDGDGGEKLLETVPLSPKELAWCEAFANPESATFGNARKSAEAANYSQAHNAGWKLRRRPRIIAKLREYHAAVTVAVGRVLADLENERRLAVEKGDIASAIRATELMGKHLGMFVDVLAVDPIETFRYDRRVAEDTRIIAMLLRQDRPAAIESPYPVAAPAAGTSPAAQDGVGAAPTTARGQSIEAPARAILEQIKALEQARARSPQTRQGE